MATTAETVKKFLELSSNPTDVVSGIRDALDGTALGAAKAATEAVSTIQTFASAAIESGALNKLGVAAAGASLLLNIVEVQKQLDEGGTVSNTTMLSIAADLATLTAALALSPELGVAAVVTAATFTTWSLLQAPDDHEMFDALVDLAAKTQDMIVSSRGAVEDFFVGLETIPLSGTDWRQSRLEVFPVFRDDSGNIVYGPGVASNSTFEDVRNAGLYNPLATIDIPEIAPPVYEDFGGRYTPPTVEIVDCSFPTPPPNPYTLGITETYFSQAEIATYVPPPTPPRCFAANTPVLMADGFAKPIEQIIVGDSVLAFDGLGELVPAQVSRTFAYDPADVVELSAEGIDAPIVATPLHRFLTADGAYKPLGTLASGDRLVGADGSAITLTRVSSGAEQVPIFNFTVEGLHTYVAGGVRVHNQKPIGIDLDGDNQIELIGLDESGVFFDTDEDGFKENTAWVGGNDGILAWDSNGDGHISQASEFVFALYGASGATDLEGLRAAFDTNGDLVLDAKDADFAQFGVWRDANQNGISEAGEFVGLAGLGITSISLVSDGVHREENGNLILGQTQFRRADGSSGLAADIDLAQVEAGFAETRRTPYRSELIDENGVKAVAVAEGASVRSLFVGLGDTTVGFGSSGDDWLTGVGSNGVTLAGGAGDDTLIGGAGNDILKGGLGADKISGGAGNDVLYIDAADLTRGISGGTGNDLVRVAGLDAVSFDLGAVGVEAAVGNAGDDHFYTTAGEGIELAGGAGNDILEGGAGNDILMGGAGADRLLGGAGDDTLMIDAEDVQADIDAGDGVDTVVLENQAGIAFDLGAAHAEYALGGSAADRLFTSGSAAVSIAGGGGDDSISGGVGNDTLTGGEGNDFIEGGAGNDTIGGGLGNDHLVGGAGNDILMGGAGSDSLDGGEGNDVLEVDADDNLAALSGGAGQDVLHVADGRGVTVDLGAAQIETAFGNDGADHFFTIGTAAIAADGGAGNDWLAGGAGDDQLLGGAGNDILEGGAGNDTLVGGQGADRLLGGAGDDTLIINGEDINGNIDGGAGHDTVLIDDAAGVFFDLGLSHVEEAQGGAGNDRLYTTGTEAISVFGGAGNDQLLGGAGNDTLSGGSGADVLKGGAGDDRLVIDAADLQNNIDGGVGYDTLVIEDTAGRVFDAGLANVEAVQGGDGNDRLVTSGTGAVDLRGGAGNDVITGGVAGDTLAGGAGSDTLIGGAGNDTLIIDRDDLVGNLDGGVGTDTIVIDDDRGVAIDIALAKAERGFGGAGADTLSYSGTGGVYLEGGEGNDRLQGGTGNDTLIGGAGADTLIGGAGDDTLIIDAQDLMSAINGGTGTDTIIVEGTAGVTLNLGAVAAEAAIGGDGNDVLAAGNALGVRLDGGAGNDSLQGGAGNDILVGGAGADSLFGGAGDDTLYIDADDLVVSGGSGRDRIVVDGSRGVTVDLGLAEVEVASGGAGDDVFLNTGSQATHVLGEAGNDHISGGGGDDQIEGGTGNDILAGGIGNDIMLGGEGNDRLAGDGGEDVLDGGVGTDTGVYVGRASDYSVEVARVAVGGTGQTRLVAQVKDLRTGEEDALFDVERLAFSDRELDLTSSNRVPVATPDRLRAYKETPISIQRSVLIGNDWDLDKDKLLISAVSNAVGGTVSFNYSKQQIAFTPNAGFTGLASFNYSIFDSALNQDTTGVVTVEVDPYKPTSLPTDTLFPAQWNLFNIGQTIGSRPGMDLNLVGAWDDYTGEGVTVANIEGQVEYTNLELVSDYNAAIDIDFQMNYLYFRGVIYQFVTSDNDPIIQLPTNVGHSTATSGFITADRNGVGVVGVAYDANLFLAAVGKDGKSDLTLFDDAINYAWNVGADVANFIGIYAADSGAPSSDNVSPILSALHDGATYGRDGLGMPVAITGGNEYSEGYDTNYWGPTGSRYVASVAAMMPDGSTTDWATPGASLLVTAPGQWMMALDVTGANGYSSGDSYLFSGTCGSTPQVTGVMALMLEANSDLGYRDVYEILAYSSRLTADETWQWQENGADNWNGGGLHVSHRAGYGLVDARAAVRLAETWQSVSTATNEQMVGGSSAANQAIPDMGTITDTITLNDSVMVDRVEVDLNIQHGWVGDLVVTLVSPDGTESVLVNRPGKDPDNLNAVGFGSQNFVYTVGSTHHYGELSGGNWTLKVEDAHGGYTGTLNSWSLRLYGDAETSNDTYIYTNEYIYLSGEENANRRVLSDAAGIDTINAAAVNYDTVLDLSGATASRIANNDFAIAYGTVIENVYTGDGADRVYGNAVNNILYGGRGNDVLVGGSGADILDGGDGFDTVSYADSAAGVVVDLSQGKGYGGDAEGDRLSGIERVEGAAYADHLLGSAGADWLTGGAGDDLLEGGAGDDVAQFTGKAGDYVVANSNGRFLVTDRRGSDGADTLFGIEQLRFADRTIRISTAGDNAPFAGDDQANAIEDTALVLMPAELLANDSDVDGDAFTITAIGSASHGSVVRDANGKIVFTPEANYFGEAGFAYTVTDATGRSGQGWVRIDITSVNDAPVATLAAIQATEDVNLKLTPTALAQDVEGDALTLENFDATTAQGGSLSRQADGSLRYVPVANFYGTDSFAYTVTDGHGGVVSHVAQINVAAVNDAPITGADTFAMNEDEVLVISADALLVNDSDIEGQALRVASVGNAYHGTVALNASGQIVFTPSANYFGDANFEYTVTDAGGASAAQKVMVTVVPVADPPIARVDILSGEKDIPLVIAPSQLLANDYDPDGDTLHLAWVGNAANGMVALDADGNVVFTPNAGFAGTAGFDYGVVDPQGNTASQSVFVDVATLDYDYGQKVLVGGGEFAIAEDPSVYEFLPRVAGLRNGGFVSLWRADYEIYGQLSNANGRSLGAKFQIGTAYGNEQSIAVSSVANGGFVVAWQKRVWSQSGWSSTYNDYIYGRRYDATGSALGQEFLIGNTSYGSIAPAITETQDGGFLVSWSGATSYSVSGSWYKTYTYYYDVFAKRYDQNGNAASSDMLVNTYTTDSQNNSRITTLTYGEYVVVWVSSPQVTGGSVGIYGQRLSSAGAKIGPEFKVNTSYNNYVDQPRVTNLRDGGFFVIWRQDGIDGSGYGVAGQRYDRQGQRLGGVLQINTFTTGYVREPSITSLSDDGFVVSWATYGKEGTGVNIYAQRFDDQARAVGGEFRLNSDINGYNYMPELAGLANGGFVAAWNPYATNDYDIHGQIFQNSIPPLARLDEVSGIEDQLLVLDAATLLVNDRDVLGGALHINNVDNASGGSVTLNADGTINFTPLANFNGEAGFDYTVANPQGLTSTGHVQVDIAPVKDAPVASGDTFALAEDGLLSLSAEQGVLHNDHDADGDVINVVDFDAVSTNGSTVTMNPDGSFTYRPVANFNGADSFTYTVSDGQGSFSTATVVINIGAVNDAPVAEADSYATEEGMALSVSVATGVLVNDTDTEGNALRVAGWDATTQRGGAMVMNQDGSFTYTPPAHFAGADLFQYTVSDGQGGTTTAQVTLNVAPGSSAPHTTDDAYSGSEDTPLNVDAQHGLLTNDVDPNGDVLTVSRFDLTTAEGGTVVVNGDGSFTYRPRTDFHGPDSFTYDVSDGNGGLAVATARIEVLSVNDNPVAGADVFTVTANTSLVVAAANGLLVNDHDADGDSLQVIGVDAVSEAGGSITAGTDGGFVYRPADGFSGDDHFVYRVSDGQGGVTEARVTVTVEPEISTPTPGDDAFVVDEDGVLSVTAAGGVLLNDSDPNGDALVVSAYDQNTEQGGFVIMQADGGFSYIPATDFFGEDHFSYTVTDATGKRATATVAVTVNPIAEVDDPSNRRLVLYDDFYEMNEDGVLAVATEGGVIGTDNLDADGNPVVVSAYDAVTAHGSVAMNPDGSFVYTPEADFYGRDSFTYTIDNGQGATATATVTMTVNSVNDLPVATPNVATTTEDTPVVLNAADLLAGAYDPEGDSLSLHGVGNATHGTALIDADGNIVFTPEANFSGEASFEYSVSDGNGGLASSVVTVSVTAVNDAPVAADDAFSVGEDAALLLSTADLLGNDGDPDGDALSVVSVQNAVNGSVGVEADGRIRFTPDADFHGTAGFDYTITDGSGLVSTAHADVTVAAVNDLPLAGADMFVAQEDSALVIRPAQLLGNDSDIDGDILQVHSVSDASHGSVMIDGAGNVVFTAEANFYGEAGFSYTIDDGNGGYATATAVVNVLGVNDAPVAVGEQFNLAEDAVLSIPVATLTVNDSDIDGDVVSVAAVGNALHGTAAIVDGQVIFTPDANYFGQASFDYALIDGNGGVSYATVGLEIESVNDLPIAAADRLVTAEDSAIVISAAKLLANDRDPDGDALHLDSVGNAQNGTVSLDDQGRVVFVPTANFSGIATFDYTLSDATGATASATVSVVVTPVNDVPIVTDDHLALNEDQRLVIAPLSLVGNDLDADGDYLKITGINSATHGTVAFDQSGNVVFTPEANYYGSASFEYTVSDLKGGIASGTAYLDIASVNDLPVAVGDVAIANEDSPLVISSMALLANDSDVDVGDLLGITGLDVSSTSGTAILNSDGNVVYSAGDAFQSLAAGETGTDQFVYVANDGHGGEAMATVSVEVVGINDLPVAQSVAYEHGEDGAAASYQFVATDVDHGATLSYEILGQPEAGVVINNNDGTFSFDPAGGFESLAVGETREVNFGYRVTDEHGATSEALASITVVGANDLPVAQSVAYEHGEDGLASSYNFVATDVDHGAILSYELLGQPEAGMVVNNGDGTFSFDPANGFESLAAGETREVSFGYRVTDEHGATSEALASITVVGTNDAPVAQGVAYEHGEDGTAANYSFVATDVDHGATLSYEILGQPEAGMVVNNGDGTFSFDPAGGFESLAAGETQEVSFGYRVADEHGAISEALASITVVGVNDLPVAQSVAYEHGEDGLAASYSFVATDVDHGAILSYELLGQPESGMVINNNDGTFSFDPAGGFESLAVGETQKVSFGYRVTDEHGGTSEALTSITVVGANDLPVAQSVAYEHGEDGLAASYSFVATDVDHGATLSYEILGQPEVGVVINNGDGTFSFDPAGGFESLAVGETREVNFGYRVTDEHGATSEALASITVVGANDLPVAQSVAYEHGEDGLAASYQFVATDVDHGATLSYEILGQPEAGVVINNNDGTFSFDPAGEFESLAVGETREVSFGYRVTDEHGAISEALASITVVGANDLPVAEMDSAVTDEDTPLHLTPGYLLMNDHDVDASDVLSVQTLDTSATLGNVAIEADGTFSYVAGEAFQSLQIGEMATDSFAYTIADGHGGFATSAMTVNVMGVNDGPIAANDVAGTVGAYEYLRIDPASLLANDTDIDGDTLKIVSVGNAVYGQVVMTEDGAIFFAPDFGYSGRATFDYTVADGFGGYSTATVSLNSVLPDNLILGSDNADRLRGTRAANVIDGRAGNDELEGRSGNDILVGGTGNDKLDGDAGNDVFLFGGSNNGFDEVKGGKGYDRILGSIGDDVIGLKEFSCWNGVEEIDGGLGINVLQAAPKANLDFSETLLVNIDRIEGSFYSDEIRGSAGNDRILGLGGNDELDGYSGNDVLDGGDGYDKLKGGSGNDTLLGSAGNDELKGGLGDDVLDGGEGNDKLCGEGGADQLFGGVGDDFLSGGFGNDLLDGGSGNDDLTGYGGTDHLIGGAGNDILRGGRDNDWLEGGDGNDRLYGNGGQNILDGGAGDDTYIFQRGSGNDRIVDTQGSNTLLIGGGLSKFNLEAGRVGDSLTIHILGTEDFVTLENWYSQAEGVNRIVFDNGATLDRAGIDALLSQSSSRQDHEHGSGGASSSGFGSRKYSDNLRATSSETDKYSKSKDDEDIVEGWGKQKAAPALLTAAQWETHAQTMTTSGNQVDPSVMFGRWLTMDLAVSKALADKKTLSWLDERLGADTTALSKASAGFLGSTTPFGTDLFSLQAGHGQELKGFKGLSEGLRKVA